MSSKPIPVEVVPLTPEQAREVTVQMPNLPLMYFNHARVVSSNFDIRVFFGIGNITAQGQQTLVEQLCVVLTPEFASELTSTLRSNIEGFEKRFGKVRPRAVPPVAVSQENESPRKRKKTA
jgi:hypothetical protein